MISDISPGVKCTPFFTGVEVISDISPGVKCTPVWIQRDVTISPQGGGVKCTPYTYEKCE